MVWLSWRQFRAQAASAWIVVAAAVTVLAVTGRRLASLPRTGADVYDALTGSDQLLFYAGVIVVGLAPALVGAFWGAPLVARELENGTHRLAWNQSVTRRRWLATKLALATLVTVASVGALSGAVTWWAGPVDGAAGNARGALPARLTPVTFAMRGIVPIGYAVFALMLGVCVGMVLRRSIPAMALTLALFTAVQVAVPLWVRPHLIPPRQATLAFSPATLQGVSSEGPGRPVTLSLHTASRADWILSRATVNGAGRAVAVPGWFSACMPTPGGPVEGRTQAPSLDNCLDRLTASGYRQHLSYQPARRFWPLQWAETGLFLLLAALLCAVNLALVGRRG